MDFELTVDAPEDVEALWRRLATVLPAFVRFHVPEPVRNGPVPDTLPELCGPTRLPNRPALTYECSELGTTGTLDLLAIDDEEGRTHRSIMMTIIQATISPGIIVASMWSIDGPEAVTRVGLTCRYYDFEATMAVLQPIGLSYVERPKVT